MKAHLERMLIFFSGGVLAAFFGGILGLGIGMTLGGVIDLPFYYGGLRGYEGAGLLGSILGLSLATYAWIHLRLPIIIVRHAKILLLAATALTLLLQDSIARNNGVGIFWVTFLPIVSQILLLVIHTPEDF